MKRRKGSLVGEATKVKNTPCPPKNDVKGSSLPGACTQSPYSQPNHMHLYGVKYGMVPYPNCRQTFSDENLNHVYDIMLPVRDYVCVVVPPMISGGVT